MANDAISSTSRGSLNSPFTLPVYVLVTPARNEADYIELTLESMIKQTVKPLKWIIVSDGSNDGTDDIVRKYVDRYDWIELARTPERAERHFAGKVHAFNVGYEKLKGFDFDIIGNLDGDISFDEDYFNFLLRKFAENTRLGVGGTPFIEGDRQYDYNFTNIEHVSGQCQMFRRACFESIGGYVPMKEGGIDLVAVITARMNSWQTRSFPEKVFEHHRKMGTGMYGGLNLPFKGGYHDYLMGGHPLWQFLRSLYQMRSKPYVVYGGVLFLGYLWALLTRAVRPVSSELVAFRQKEQMARMRFIFLRFFHMERLRVFSS